MSCSEYWNYQSKTAADVIKQVSEEDQLHHLRLNRPLNLSHKDHCLNHNISLLLPHRPHHHENLPLLHSISTLLLVFELFIRSRLMKLGS